MAFGFTTSAKQRKPPPTPKSPELNATQFQQLKVVAHMTCSDLVYASRLTANNKHGVTWTPIDSDDNRLQYYTGRMDNPPPTHDLRFMCCVTKVHASLDEVIDVLNGSRGSGMAADIKANLDSDVVKMATLKVLKHLDQLKMRLRWMVLKSASPYIPMRDYVYLECQNDIRVLGKDGWACSMHSIALPAFPNFEESHGVLRGSCYRTGYVVTETHTPGELRVVHMMQADFKGCGMPSQTADMMMKNRVGNISYLSDYFRKMALIHRMVTLHPQQKTEAKSCTRCTKKFSLLSKKHTCRLCGEIVCSSCSTTKEFDENIPDLRDIRVCNTCNADDANLLMESVLTEVLMRPSSTDGAAVEKPPVYKRNPAIARESDILGESPADDDHLHVVHPSNKRFVLPASSSVILEDEEDDHDTEPLPLPRIAYLDNKAKAIQALAQQQQPQPTGPTLTKNWLGQDMSSAVASSSVESVQSSMSLSFTALNALNAPRGEQASLDWLDPLDSFRNSVASSHHRQSLRSFSSHSTASSTPASVADLGPVHRPSRVHHL
ncbi:Aste57867_6942 [Aphanomyces stellatus]|uniref:Aste57867_6942 protein n=1 Tax=Aphanomyces stellatus TaxID=120398 RepID=A0A485KHY9_9STRA|nr:hypothetical protein As57867_006920 [Aphanomyces stellatus]VFT83894.1 Aste57867_6942 [Aphanomyces stellatus]